MPLLFPGRKSNLTILDQETLREEEEEEYVPKAREKGHTILIKGLHRTKVLLTLLLLAAWITWTWVEIINLYALTSYPNLEDTIRLVAALALFPFLVVFGLFSLTPTSIELDNIGITQKGFLVHRTINWDDVNWVRLGGVEPLYKMSFICQVITVSAFLKQQHLPLKSSPPLTLPAKRHKPDQLRI